MANGTSIEERFEQMVRRLDRAERANRAIKIWSAIAFAVLLAFGAGPFASTVMAKKVKAPPAQIVAQEFVLETSTGTPLAVLTAGEGGSGLAFLSGGTVRTLIGFNPTNGGGVETYDASETLRTELGTDPTGSGPNGLEVYDSTGKARLGVSQSASIGNTFFLQDDDGAVRSFLGSTNDGTSVGVQVFDQQATPVLRDIFGWDSTAGEGLALFNASGTSVFAEP